jgi:hypothetical protein
MQTGFMALAERSAFDAALTASKTSNQQGM